ncbi:unnamed protein product, partial [Medioppia subpectinata]
ERRVKSKPGAKHPTPSVTTAPGVECSDSSVDSSTTTSTSDKIAVYDHYIDITDTFPDINIIDIYKEMSSSLDYVCNSSPTDSLLDYDSSPTGGTPEPDLSVVPLSPTLSTTCGPLFNQLEANRLSELLNAALVFSTNRAGSNNPVPDPTRRRVSLALTYDDVYKVMGHALEAKVISCVQLCQQLSPFGDICDNDRISLIKYGCYDMFCARALTVYDRDRDYWTHSMDNDESCIVTLKQVFPHLRERYGHLFQTLCREVDSDSVVLDLLTVIILFNSDRPMLVHRDLVKFQQNIYMYLLRRYLLLKYSTECEAEYKYQTLMKCLRELNVLGVKHREYIEFTDARKIRQTLLVEIFDLKPSITE